MKIIKVDEIKYAKTYSDKLIGFMFKRRPETKKIIIFEKCKSVHTFNMKFGLDILFLNENCEVLKIKREVPRGRIVSSTKGATIVVEAPEGLFSGVNLHDIVRFDAPTVIK